MGDVERSCPQSTDERGRVHRVRPVAASNAAVATQSSTLRVVCALAPPTRPMEPM